MNEALAWDLGTEGTTAERADRETRISDFLLFALLPLTGLVVPPDIIPGITLPDVHVPVSELAGVTLVTLVVFRQPRAGARAPRWFSGLLVAIVAILAMSAARNDLDASRRLLHIISYVGIAISLASERVSMLSAARGLSVSLAAAVVHGAVTVGGDGAYAGRLTGVLADPNVAAFLLITLGAVSVPHVQHKWLRRVLMATIVAGVILTFSRTGLLALVFGTVWLLVGRRLRLAGGGLLVAGLVWLVDNIPDDLRLLGPFADRTGSDSLRFRIDAKQTEVVASAPWYGNGPGTARVRVGDDFFFFHNSYLAVRNEGGWVVLILVLAVLAGCFALLNRPAKLGATACVWMQVGLIGVLVMAVSLGEVLLELPTAVVLGFAMSTAISRGRSDSGVTDIDAALRPSGPSP